MSLRHASLALHMKSKRKLWLPAMGADSQRRSTPKKQNFFNESFVYYLAVEIVEIFSIDPAIRQEACQISSGSRGCRIVIVLMSKRGINPEDEQPNLHKIRVQHIDRQQSDSRDRNDQCSSAR